MWLMRVVRFSRSNSISRSFLDIRSSIFAALAIQESGDGALFGEGEGEADW